VKKTTANKENQDDDEIEIVQQSQPQQLDTSNKPKTYRLARKAFTPELITGDDIETNPQSTNYKRHIFHKRDAECPKCKALMWKEESLARKSNTFGLCCTNGVVEITHQKINKTIATLINKNKHFLDNIRTFNNVLSFTSIHTKLNDHMDKKDSKGKNIIFTPLFLASIFINLNSIVRNFHISSKRLIQPLNI
jgi:hypothetical protein